ncbi:hypothetical protein [Marinilabilia sp.]|uniref:hypothetical protein n=1 Tax=Marinilabilia sp. TaxID=2021252 RepID=UPI0025B7DC15|nr:hypothetical protein [Marinilabilia sp.]
MKNCHLKPAYNLQISTENQIIANFSLHQKPGNTAISNLNPHLQQCEQQQNKQSKEIVANSVYGSGKNYECFENQGLQTYIKYNYFHKEQKGKLIHFYHQTNISMLSRIFWIVL